MKKLIIIPFFSIISLNLAAQINAVNIGYQDDPDVISIGGLFSSFDAEIFFGPISDSSEDSKSTFGAKVGYMFYLHNDWASAVYLGPQIGYYNSENFSQSTSESGLIYGGQLGFYFSPINIAVGYGANDVSGGEYFSIKFGFNPFELMGG